MTDVLTAVRGIHQRKLVLISSGTQFFWLRNMKTSEDNIKFQPN